MNRYLRALCAVALLFPFLLSGLTPARAAHEPAAGAASIPLDRPLRFERFSLSDGLSQNSVLAMLQDRKGYLWFGTQDGLNRYDGYGFTVFKHDPDNADSLSNNGVISLLEDKEGILWVGTWGGGLDRFDPSSGRFTRYQHDPKDEASLGADIVAALYEDSVGRLWVGTIGGGLDRLDRATGKFSHARNDPANPDSLSSDAVSAILEDPSGALWVGTGGFSIPGAGLNRFDPQTGKAVRYRSSPNDPATLSNDNIAAIQRGADGTLWIATGGYALPGAGLDRFDPQTGKTARYQTDPKVPASLASNDLLNLSLDPAGILWIATYGGGLDRLDTAHLESGFIHTRSNPYNPESLSSDQVWSLLRDRSGVIWIGTVNGGLDKINPQYQQFRLFRNDPANSASLGFNAVGPMMEDREGRIWIGTYGGGLDLFVPALGTFTHFPVPGGSANTVMSIGQDARGTLWVGTLNGLAAFDPASGKFAFSTHDPAAADSIRDNNVSGVIEDGQHHLWVATLAGLDVYDRDTGKFTHIAVDGLSPVVTLFLDHEQKLWVGTWGNGLFRLDPSTLHGAAVQVLERFQNDPQNPASISDNSIWSMVEQPDGTLWLGTSGGLNRYDPVARIFRHYREKDGLANDTALCILREDSGTLWISTNNGISRFDQPGGAPVVFRTYQSSDGLQSNEFDSGSCLMTRSGELYFGGVHGLSAFLPADIQANGAPPPLVITSFRIFNETYPIDQSGGTPIRLSYRQDFISFEFAALDFHAPQKNQYAYKLEGFDRDWVQAGNRHYASYTNLNGGTYTFRVKAANNDGVWNADGISIPIQITPPFWASWWFLGGAALLALTAIVAAVVWRLDTVRDQNRRLERLVSERTLTLRDTNQQLEVEVEQRKRAEEALSRRAAEELRQSEARFRAMFENAAVGIGLMSLDRVVLECNDAVTQLFGYTPAEFINRSSTEMIHPEDRALDADLYAELIAGERRSYQVEKRYLHKDGHYVWAKLILSAVRGPDGQALYLLGMLVDIDEQKRIEQELSEQEANYRRLLEQRVYERTLELRKTNEQLQSEMDQRLRVEEALALKAAEEAVVAERNRLARDLHDAVTQTLFSASLLAEVLPDLFRLQPAEAEKRLEELRQLTRGALAEMRTLLVELRPSALTDIPLSDLLRQLGDATIGRARLPVEIVVDGEADLPGDVQVALYRIAQEALNNSVKYAHASSANINLRLSAASVRLTVIDNGVGFDPENIPPNHFGLRIMRERAEAIGARLSVYSEPGQGTQITVTWIGRS